jgi:hypothetical protein
MSTAEPINTKTITEMSQIGAPLTGELEEVLLHDPNSILYKEHLAMLVREVDEKIDLENLAQFLQSEKQLLEKIEERDFADKKAHEADLKKKHNQQADDDAKKPEYQLTPTKIVKPEAAALKHLTALVNLNLQITQIQQAQQQVQANQRVIKNQWQIQQQQQAQQLIQGLNGVPVLLPNGVPLPAMVLNFDAASPEALELQQRLEAAPMMSDMLNTLEKSDMRNIYNKQVLIQELKIRQAHPEFSQDEMALELAARQQAVYDLNLDLRQLQNKYILSITAIHNFMKRQGVHHIENMVEQYNQALGINIEATPHKKVGIYKILENTISSYLTPKLLMENRKNKRNEVDNVDELDLQVQAMKGVIQENSLQRQSLAKLNMLRSLVASLRMVASENAEFSFLNNICDRVALQTLQAPGKKNNFRLVPKGFNI